MIRSLSRAAKLALCAAAVLAPAVASATSYTFDFTSWAQYNTSTGLFTATANDGSSVSGKVSAWHATDADTSKTTKDTVAKATGYLYEGYGLGISYGNDTSSNETHQIDNYGTGQYAGTDFLMIQFDQDVTLSSIGQYVFKMSNVSCCDSDVSYWADANNVYGSPSTSSIALAGTTVSEGDFTTLGGATTSGTNTIKLASSPSASVWMIGAAFNQANDGFKLSSLVVNTAPPAAVPEPASWAMMIVGFGAIGGSLRARRRSIAFA